MSYWMPKFIIKWKCSCFLKKIAKFEQMDPSKMTDKEAKELLKLQSDIEKMCRKTGA